MFKEVSARGWIYCLNLHLAEAGLNGFSRKIKADSLAHNPMRVHPRSEIRGRLIMFVNLVHMKYVKNKVVRFEESQEGDAFDLT